MQSISREPRVLLQDGWEEGYLDLYCVRQIYYGDKTVNCGAILKRYGVRENAVLPEHCSINILYGTSIADNRVLRLLMPTNTAKVWLLIVGSLLKVIRSQNANPDRRLLWLKHEYLRLVHAKDDCEGPTLADTTKVRCWEKSPNFGQPWGVPRSQQK